jgi:predicted RNA-binding Zn ribbon-like protein
MGEFERYTPPEARQEAKIEKVEKPRFNPETIRNIQHGPAETADADEMALNTASERADHTVEKHRDTPEAQQVEFYKVRGRIGEELAAANMPDSNNLNDVTGKSNFANYDVISPYEVASVKVKERNNGGQPRYGDYNKYFRDITNPNARANQRAATDLLQMKSEEPEQWQQVAQHLPSEVKIAQDQTQMTAALTDSASLRIPGDQVAEVRENLKQRAMAKPAEYGLDSQASPADLEQQVQRLMRDRVKPIDKRFDTGDMSVAADEVVAGRHYK